jgi:hypothetical protein
MLEVKECPVRRLAAHGDANVARNARAGLAQADVAGDGRNAFAPVRKFATRKVQKRGPMTAKHRAPTAPEVVMRHRSRDADAWGTTAPIAPVPN